MHYKYTINTLQISALLIEYTSRYKDAKLGREVLLEYDQSVRSRRLDLYSQHREMALLSSGNAGMLMSHSLSAISIFEYALL